MSVEAVEVMELTPHPDGRYAPADAVQVPGALIAAQQLALFRLRAAEVDIRAHLERTGQA